MSAFTISGLVLAMIPICQGAIIKQASTMNDAKQQRFMTELSNYIRRLRMQYDQLELSLRRLLAPVLSAAEINEMIKNPSGPRWSESSVRDQLVEKHGELYNSFESDITLICSTMSKIAAKLGLGSSNMAIEEMRSLVQLPVANQHGRSFVQRFRVASDFDEVNELFEQLKRVQNNLDSLMHKNDNQAVALPQAAVAKTAPLQLLRQRVMALYTVLEKLAHCEEHSTHCANLRLESRAAVTNENSTEDRSPGNRFHITLAEPWGRTNGEVFIHDGSSASPEDSPPTAQTNVDAREHICPVVEQYRGQMPCMGFCIDMNSEARLTGLYHASSVEPATEGETTDLATLLTPLHPLRPRLAWGDRMSLAVTLVSAISQLHTTHWLAETWSEKDIIFLPRPARSSGSTFDLRKPYIVHHFSASINAAQMYRRTAEMPVNKRAALLNLGIVLMELWFGRRMEYASEQGEGNNAELELRLRANALEDWVHLEGDELPKRIYQAVAMCRCLDSQDEDKIADELRRIVRDLTSILEASG